MTAGGIQRVYVKSLRTTGTLRGYVGGILPPFPLSAAPGSGIWSLSLSAFIAVRCSSHDWSPRESIYRAADRPVRKAGALAELPVTINCRAVVELKGEKQLNAVNCESEIWRKSASAKKRKVEEVIMDLAQLCEGSKTAKLVVHRNSAPLPTKFTTVVTGLDSNWCPVPCYSNRILETSAIQHLKLCHAASDLVLIVLQDVKASEIEEHLTLHQKRLADGVVLAPYVTPPEILPALVRRLESIWAPRICSTEWEYNKEELHTHTKDIAQLYLDNSYRQVPKTYDQDLQDWEDEIGSAFGRQASRPIFDR
ncbi:hypothetical protein DFH06DRAFT_1130531 [Mycena polygramma]|nr:hypothetical protein DFH06DRAFT_1130531 [Mycena polygramma]